MDSPRFIILEGPDGGGKSTLAADLADCFFNVIHTGPPKTSTPYREYVQSIATSYMRQSMGIDERPVVFDRLHVGERIYGPVLRDIDRLGQIGYRQIQRILMGINAIILHCSTDPETMQKTWSKRMAEGKELITDSSRYYQLFSWYRELLGDCPFAFDFDYQKNNLEWVLSIPVPWPNAGPGIGAWRPGHSTLIVGERVNESAYGTDWPFTGYGNSSYWLTEKLEEANISEHDLYWVNCEKPDGDLHDPSFIEALNPKRIIALGIRARKWLKDAGLSAVDVPHPQYWRRFHNHETYPIAEAIRHG